MGWACGMDYGTGTRVCDAADAISHQQRILTRISLDDDDGDDVGAAGCRLHRYRFLFAGHVIGRQLFAICRHSTMKGRDGRRRRR